MDIKLDSNGDIKVEGNSLYVTEEGTDSIAQRLRIRLRFFFREWILDRSQGTKWFELVLKKNVDKYTADQEIRRIVLETAEVKSIESWESSIDSGRRTYDVTFTVRTIYGQQITFGFSDLLKE